MSTLTQQPKPTPAPAGRPTGLLAATRGEMLRVRRWPAVWLIVAAWLALNAFFAYIFNYITYTSGDTGFGNAGQSRAELLASLLPGAVPDSLPQGMPLFGGALMMVLGAIVAGSGYGWGTWKTVFTQGPSRSRAVLGSVLAMTSIVVVVVLAALASDLALALGIAGLESQAVVWPGIGATLHAVGVGPLVLEMWALAGFFLGTVARGPAVSVGLGLVWALVIENLLRGVGGSISAIATLTHFLPGTAAGSLVGQLVGVGGPDTTPGLLDTLGSGRALATVVAWMVVLPLLSLWLVRRRDVS